MILLIGREFIFEVIIIEVEVADSVYDKHMFVLLSAGNSLWSAMSRREIWKKLFPGMSVSQQWRLCVIYWTVHL